MSTQTFVFLAIVAVSLSVSASAKTGSTLVPPDRVQNAHRNIERYDWAKSIRTASVNAAESYARHGDDFLWELVTPQDIPRGTQVNRELGCPKCGKAIERFGNYPWIVDVAKSPWKIKCPSCGEVFPKNDFARFYESGKDEHGVFHYGRADRSLLFNTDHPDPDDPLHTYGVDDTMGWKAPNGSTYRFIGYYGHYGTWASVINAVMCLRQAYIYTGNPTYGRKAALMLYRAAELYPDMDWHKWSELGFANSDGGSGKGKVYGRIWEMNVANSMLMAYDGVYSCFDDHALLSYLAKKTGKRVSASDARHLIERNIVQGAHDAILDGEIVGNEGMHQSTMAMAAVVMDTPGITDKWLDWIFAPGDVAHGDPRGGNIARIFESKVDDDGMGNEGSPLYNGLWRRTFRNISEVIEHYPAYKGRTFVDFPKYKKMFEAAVRLVCLGRYVPHVGDCGKCGDPDLCGLSVADLVYAYRTFRDPIFAQMAYYINGNKSEGIVGDIYDSDPEGLAAEIESIVKEQGPYVPRTDNMPAYGLAILRGGKGENQHALSIYYGSNAGHAHMDTLNMELFGHGLDLMPDLGYPEQATVWPSRYEWTSNTISHNTVTVDRRKQGGNKVGKARFVSESNGVSAAEIYAPEPYPNTSLYQRTTAMVDVSDKDFYVVDIFRVKGGKEHHYSLHGPEGEIDTEGLSLVARKKGTLAGENVPYGVDMGGRQQLWRDSSGFQYLYDVRRDAHPSDAPTVTWMVRDTWHALKKPIDLRLRMHLVNPPGEVILAHGDPARNKPGNPRRLTYVILPDESSDSTFVSVIEPYVGRSIIKSIERTDRAGTVILKIALNSGRVDYVISATEPTQLAAGDCTVSGRFAVLTEQDGRVEARLVERQ